MKNATYRRHAIASKMRTLGTIMLVIAVVFAITTCGDGGGNNNNTSSIDTTLNGTWDRGDHYHYAYTFNNGSWEDSADDFIYGVKGTYTTSGNKITLTITHCHGYNLRLNGAPSTALKWYSKSELKAASSIKTELGISDEDIDDAFETGTYSITGDKLTLGGMTFTKKQ